MKFNSELNKIKSSITLQLNAKANELKAQGQSVINLTAGQLPFKPDGRFVENISRSLEEIESFQYSPVAGFSGLREKLIQYVQSSRNIEFEDVDCLVSNGGKHSLFVMLSALLNPGDEVILLAPYWLSYPSMVKLAGGKVVPIESSIFSNYQPKIEDIAKAITSKTKAIILNSPSNPSGVCYSHSWMESFTGLLQENPDLWVISDEIYFELCYFDPAPKYFYQYDKELLKRTLIFDGISKSMAATGLRLGYCIGPKELIQLAGRFQSHTASGVNSLIQRAVERYNLNDLPEYMTHVKNHLRENADRLKKSFIDNGLSSSWYQTTAAFYFLLDYSTTPRFGNRDKNEDHALELSNELLAEKGLVVVPTSDFGMPNCARVSLVSEPAEFAEAMEKLVDFLSSTP